MLNGGGYPGVINCKMSFRHCEPTQLLHYDTPDTSRFFRTEWGYKWGYKWANGAINEKEDDAQVSDKKYFTIFKKIWKRINN